MRFEEIARRLKKMEIDGVITKKEAGRATGEALRRYIKMGVCVVVEQQTANKKRKWAFKKMSEKQMREAEEMWDEFDRKFGIKSQSNLNM